MTTTAPIASVKVIAAGWISDEELRAVVSVTPAYSDNDPIEMLATWPTRMLDWLEDAKWKISLRIEPAVAMPKSGGGWFWRPPDGNAAQDSKLPPLVACAEAAASAWDNHSKRDWLNDLWTRSITCMEPPKTTDAVARWKDHFQNLGATLQSSVMGTALQAGQELNGASETTNRTVKPNDKVQRQVAGNGDSLTIESVIPSRQSDLAVLFELQRVLELCETVQAAFHAKDGDSKTTQNQAAASAPAYKAAADKPNSSQPNSSKPSADKSADASPTVDLTKYHKDAANQYKVAVEQLNRSSATGKHTLCEIPTQSGGQSNPQVPHSDPQGVAGAPIGVTDKKYQDGLELALGSYQAATRRQLANDAARSSECFQHDESEQTKSVVAQRFFAIQGSPALARLFALTFDVVISKSELVVALNRAFTNDSQPAIGRDGGQYVLLAAGDSMKCTNGVSCSVHSLAKFRDPKSDRADANLGRHFFPATRAEIQVEAQPTCQNPPSVSQYDGLVTLGQKVLSAENRRIDRFELSSLNVRAAAEAELDNRAQELNSQERFSSADSNPQNPDTSGGCSIAYEPPRERKTYLTAGLTLLDRGRQQQATAQLAARDQHGNKAANAQSHIVLDADDMLVGYRLDVGVPVKDKNNYLWRPLTSRKIEHGLTGLHATEVQRTLRSLFADNFDRKSGDSPWQRRLEDEIVSLPVRLIPNALDTAELPDVPKPPSTSVDAYVEEALLTWTGEPFAVSTSGTRAQKTKKNCELPIGRVLCLPNARTSRELCPPPLRFGCPYRVGVRGVYAGGLSVSLEEATAAYDRSPSKTWVPPSALALPASVSQLAKDTKISPEACAPALCAPAAKDRNPVETRRFLRHERINAPTLLLPESIAFLRSNLMGYQRAAHAIVRTAYTPKEKARATPTETQRIFAVPSVDQSFAILHGVIDGCSSAKPRDGLNSPLFGSHGVRFDADGGGFPVVTTRSITGINGVEYEVSRWLATDTAEHHGDLVYSMSKGENRKVPYLPDPAVDSYVIAVRYAGANRYLKGPAVPVKAYSGSVNRYPDARPLAINIVRAKHRHIRADNLEHRDVLKKAGEPGAAVSSLRRPPGTVEVVLALSPGDDFELDVWCVPTAEQLASRFAVVEAVSAVALAQKTAGQSDIESFLTGLGKLLPKSVCDTVRKSLLGSGAVQNAIDGWDMGYAGFGGLPTPPPKVIGAIAKALHEVLLTHPIPEIAAIRTLRTTHAIDTAYCQPAFSGEKPLIKPRPAADRKTFGDYSLSGELTVHLPTVEAIEIRAKVASPHSDTLDDTSRGRGLRDIRTGTWPSVALGGTGNASSPSGSSVCAVRPHHLTPREVFGFDVSATGEVTLPTSEVILQRVDKIPVTLPLGQDPDAEGLVKLSLSTFLQPTNASNCVPRVSLPFQFSGRIARKLELRAIAYPRHSEQMRTADSRGVDGHWLRNGKPLDENLVGVSSEAVGEVWLDAAVRPSTPNALSPIPAFVWSNSVRSGRNQEKILRQSRFSLIRIPLARPWFSSGEDERLGIVVWPPNLRQQDPDALAQDLVELPSCPPVTTACGDSCDTRPKPSNRGRIVKLDQFLDEDLGPGGKFVTRWGGDPIRQVLAPDPKSKRERSPPGSTDLGHTFIPAQAFLDIDPQTRLGFEPEFIECVEMPIKSENSAALSDSDVQQVPQTMSVSLVTYKPRFDLENEQGYVDVAIEHPFEAEPFVRLGLVRYQPHAPCELRVSYPTTQWVQLLPRRTVEVRTSRAKHEMLVKVTVQGLSAFPIPVDNRCGDPVFSIDPDHQLPEPDNSVEEICPQLDAQHMMIARVIREYDFRVEVNTKGDEKGREEPGARCRRTIVQRKAQAQLTLLSPANRLTAAPATWSWSFSVPMNDELDAEEGAKYKVFIDERESRLPATYPNEPVSPTVAASGLIDAGPRFLAEITL